MNAVSLSALTIRAGTRSWTCSACRGQLARGRPSGSFGIKAFATGRGYSHGPGGGGGRRKQGSRRVLLYASSSTAAVGAATLAFSDEIKSGLESAERTGRVATALAVCINE